ncbi:MAG: shikimate dehydrogenase [Chloroflexota bacterium]
MITLGLVGFPVSHSYSPKLQNGALRALGIEGEYKLFPANPENPIELEKIIELLRRKDISGLNVTIPHKQTVIKFVDRLTDSAVKIGAVNTLYLSDTELVGDNTDWSGFYADLSKCLLGNLANRKALVIGSGGSSRAIIYSLLENNWKIYVTSRNFQKVKELCIYFNHLIEQERVFMIENDHIPEILNLCSIMVNTTPVGMVPDVDCSPIQLDLIRNKELLVYDLIYNPRETLLLNQARANGLGTRNGLGMLVEQAALSFEIWTGRPAPRDVMFRLMA